jgi:hypothetical protein
MLTRLLGKLNIDQLVRDPNRDAPPGFFSSPVPVNYGLGLKECKDFTENYLGRISSIKAGTATATFSTGIVEGKAGPG